MGFTFLVDVNLPKHFHFFNTKDFVHVVDIDPTMSDANIWQYAIKNNHIILTKDSDFYYKFVLAEKRPKIVYFRLGNMTLKELYDYFDSNWDIIVGELTKGNLILVKRKTIEVVM